MAHYLNEKAQAPFASSAPMPTSPDTLLLDAWRRAEAATYVPKPILEVAPPPPDHQPLPPPTYSAVDRVMTDAVRVQITRAEARADAQSALAYEARSNLTSVQAELESERDANARLREELVRLRTKHQEETHKNTSLRRALKDAQEEASTMRKQRDHWHEGCERAVVGRDAAVRAADRASCCATRLAIRMVRRSNSTRAARGGAADAVAAEADFAASSSSPRPEVRLPRRWRRRSQRGWRRSSGKCRACRREGRRD